MMQLRFPLAVMVVALLCLHAQAQPPIAFADAGLNAVHFVDASEGWACGDDGVIWHTMDSGKNWERQKTGTRASLRAIHFSSLDTGWAVGRIDAPNGTSIGVMLKTTNGGNHWDEVGSHALPGLSAVRFLDAKNGIVCGDSTAAFATGIFVTNDGGTKWNPVIGPCLPSCRAAEYLPDAQTVLIAGAWGKLGSLPVNRDRQFIDEASGQRPEYHEAELDPLAGRSVHAVAHSKERCFAACDGGAVLTSTDAGKSWGYVDLGLAREILASCDFRTVAVRGNHVWVAGRPGSVVLHSADAGKNWEVQQTDICVPINAIHFLDEKTGWLVGEFGTILGTTDSGKTWSVLKAGGQRAAVLAIHANGSNTPLDVVASLGASEGYLCTAASLMCADSATASPKHAGDGLRLRYAMRQAGGACAESHWSFPMSAHAAGLPPRELLATWDRAHGGKANEHLLRQAVLAIRTWRPDVIICDTYAANIPPADALVMNALKEAFKQAADPNCFPEQITTLGLKPWAPKKLYALAVNVKAAPVLLDQTIFDTTLNDAPKDYTEHATRMLAGDSKIVDRRSFVLVAHRLQGSEQHTKLMEGVTLAHGGTARRDVTRTYSDAELTAEKRKAVQLRRNLESISAITDAELGSAEKLIGSLRGEMKKMPDDLAARTAYTIATRLAAEGKWAEAREVFGMIVIHYPGHAITVEAYRWLIRFHASTEARRRNEIQQKLMLKEITFHAATNNTITPASGATTGIGKANVVEDNYKFHSPDMIFQWHAATLELEPKLAAFGPVYNRDPAAWLCFLAARRHIGKFAESDAVLMDYFKHTPGAIAMEPGVDPWRDCLASELWLANSTAMPVMPRPVSTCKLTDSRPLLDGKLEDDCWKQAHAMVLNVHASTGDNPAELRTFGSQYKTECKMSYDERYLYIAVRCEHPRGKKVEPVAKRTRNADLNGHDRVDILLDLDRDYQTYYRFQIDHRGCLAEDCWGDKSWNPKYHVAFHSDETCWTAEIAIPFIELTGERPTHGKAWAVNMTRIVPGIGLQAWSGPADGEPRPEGMGVLKFRAEK